MKNYLFQNTFSMVTSWFLIAFGYSVGKGQYVAAMVFVIVGLVAHMCSADFDSKND